MARSGLPVSERLHASGAMMPDRPEGISEAAESQHRQARGDYGVLAGFCNDCDEEWPCITVQLAHALRQARAEVERLQKERDEAQGNWAPLVYRRARDAEVEVARLRGHCEFCHAQTGAAHNPLDDSGAECPVQQVNLAAVVENALRSELEAERRRAEEAAAALQRHGYRRSCDIPACNCGDSWAHGGHAAERLREISEALGELGTTALRAVQLLMEQLDTARAEAAALREAIGAALAGLPQGERG